MARLMMILYAVIGTTLAGIGVVAAVSLNLYEFQAIIVAAVIGAVLGLPVSWLVARKLENI
ncbi:hypothetical protein [Pararhodobacter marinus]|uniref:CTP synthetase n=1 Tax=Pararhodobacter marinus TaxID=2184063 RepID=A0A2U2C411_9RHOB|nr:hypothetical protein [Pararhodobacter marinus]PWE26618.1 hypothetical protein C4N9_21200 [Pararhodobacter marinus]